MKKPFTLFLILLIITFIIVMPYYIYLHETGRIGSFPIDEREYRGIITFSDFPHPSVKNHDAYRFIKDKIEQFEYNHPGVIIEFHPIKDDNHSIDSLMNMKIKPDIVPITPDNKFIYESKFEPLNKFFKKKDLETYKDNVINSFTYKNNIYGMPFGLYTNVLFLNLDLFNKKEVDIPENDEWSYEEFLNDMVKLTYSEGKLKKKNYYGLSFDFNRDSYNIWGFLMSDGANIIDKKSNISFNGPQALSALTKLKNIYDKKIFNPLVYKDGKDKPWDSFTSEKNTAVLIDESYKIIDLKYLQSKNTLFDFNVAMYPEGNGDVPLTMSPKAYGYGITEQNNRKKLEMAFKFLKYLTDSQKSVEDLGYIPVKKGIIVSDEYMQKIEKAVKYTQNLPQSSEWYDVNKNINYIIKNGLKNDEEPKYILKRINEIINQ